MRATLFPLVAVVVSAAGIAAAWRRPTLASWASLRIQLFVVVVAGALAAGVGGWKAGAAALVGALGALAADALGAAAVPALSLLAVGLTARGFLAFGYDEATWRAFAAIAGGLAGGAAAAATARRDQTGPRTRYAAHTIALAGTVAVGAAGPAVANRLDASALPVFLAATAVAAGIVAVGLRRLPRIAPVAAPLAIALFVAAAWRVSGWFDPVLLANDGRPLAPSSPLVAVGAGVIVGFVGPLAARAAIPTLLRTAALIAGVAAGVFAAHQAAGLYGIGLAAVAALAVESLLKPTRTA